MTEIHQQPDGSIRLEIEVHHVTEGVPAKLPFESGDVTKMMDALRSEKPFKLRAILGGFNEAEDTRDELHVFFGKKSVMFWDGDGTDFAVKTSDTGIIRNLAGALILWANYQEPGFNPSGEETFAAMRLFGWHKQPDEKEVINNTRAKFYARTIGMMTMPILRRNFSDLTDIENEMAGHAKPNMTELADIRLARDYIWSEIRKRETQNEGE